MVKKQQTDKKPTIKSEEYVGVKKTDLQKTADLVVQQDEMIRQLRMMVERKEKTLTVISEQRDKYMAQRDEALDKSNQKDTLFYAMTDLCQDANEQCEELELNLDESNRKVRCYKAGFYAMFAINFTVAIIHLFC